MSPPTIFDPFRPLDERIEDVRASIANDIVRRIYNHACAVLDREQVSLLQQTYRGCVSQHRINAACPEKYLDIPYWIAHKARHVARLGLHTRADLSVLDLGAGPGHFSFITQSFGHRAIGLDIDDATLDEGVGLYADICNALGVKRTIFRIEAGKPLPPLGNFDVVTAFSAAFHLRYDASGQRRYWTLREWQLLTT